MKKILLFIGCMFFCSVAFAKVGCGVQGGVKFSPSPDGSTGITIRSEYTPWGISASYNFKEKSADLILDNWWVYKKMNSNINWFALWGMSFGGRIENESYVETGARVGIGINAFCFESCCLEFYTHAVWNPSVGVNYDRDDEKYSFRFVPACFPINAGIRVWL
ncbi:hypothetical protein [Treponema sp.]|uniref:hypothetical protein n=1 Tax=Treponema sp. TaxID=166 RepID=UPI00298DBD3C|nr:hypothetical protein [Treponema sp.]MCQ2241359.1 hypothetical protein [Treponema sp.]